ncbi:MAG: aldo/keto reductase [Burkholderiales bacterium]
MKQRRLGSAGVPVSEIGLGCNGFGSRVDLDRARAIVHTALDLGVTLFDTADIYGTRFGVPQASERFLGEILGDQRKNVLLATKYGNPRMQYRAGIRGGASRVAIMDAVDGSLKRLHTDWIDLYQLHAPDPVTPIEETLRALEDLIRQGKVRCIGCSNFAAWQAVEAHWAARHLNLTPFSTCQNEYSLLVRDVECELIPAMQRYGLGLLPYFPLAAGLLTGKYKKGSAAPEGARLTATNRLSGRYMTEANWDAIARLERFCAERGHTLLELAFSWLLAQPVVCSVIAGASSVEQLKLNVRASEWTITPEEKAVIDRLVTPVPTAPLGLQ